MNVKGGQSEETPKGGEMRKERILMGEEYQNMLHIYVQRWHNETHQTLYKRVRREGNENIMEGITSSKNTVHMYGIPVMKPPVIINSYEFKT
jgi:hypothetical protein